MAGSRGAGVDGGGRSGVTGRLAREDGQSTLEWLAVAAVVIAIVVALVLAAPGMGGSVEQAVRCLVSRVVDGGAGCAPEVSRGEPRRVCTSGVTSGILTGDVRVGVITAGAGQQVVIVEKADGTVEVTFIDSGEIGVSLEVGAKGSVAIGDPHIVDRLTDDAIDSLPPIVEQGADALKGLVNGVLGHDPPQGTPGATEGSVDATVSGEAGVVAGPASAGVEAAVSGGAGITQHPDGRLTISIEISASTAASLGIPVAFDVGAADEGTIRLEIDLAPDGTPTTGRIVVVGEGAVDSSLLPTTDLGDLLNQVTSDLPGGEAVQTVVTAELDLTDPALAEAFDDLLGAAAGLDAPGLQDAGAEVLDAIADAGTVSIETYDITSNSLGAGGSASLGAGLRAEIRGTLETATLIDARYVDPVTGTVVPWTSCLEGI
jgi:hypothetical protein